jgi:dihydrolipoamide dehydrogenase
MEFACVFHRFGSEVTVIEYLKECLPALDNDIAKRLRKYLEKQGITFKMKTAVENIADIDADVILMATGRKPRMEGYTDVDENFQMSNGVYAIGDVNGRQMLAHAAEMQAVRAVNHILGRQDGIRFDVMPAAIFTTPEAACVGPTEDQLKERGIAYTCRKAFWRANGKALSMGETEGMLKLFISADDRLLGCHAYGAHAADIVQEVSVLICRETTLGQLRDMIHIHPTLSEILKSAVD